MATQDIDYAGRQGQNAIFGDRMVGQRFPDVTVQFQYNISNRDVTTTTSGTGAASHSQGVATISTGAGVGKCELESVEPLRYQTGFDGYALFTAAFSGGTIDVGLAGTTAPSILQPSQPVHMDATRLSGSGEATVKTCSWSAGRIGGGTTDTSARPFAAANIKSGITTETNIISLQNASTFQGFTNRIVVEGTIFSCASDGTKTATVYIKQGVTLGGTPSFSDIDATNSVASIDTAGTTVTGGSTVLAIPLAKVDSRVLDMTPFRFRLYPGQTMTFSAESSSATEIDIGLNWQELF